MKKYTFFFKEYSGFGEGKKKMELDWNEIKT